MTDHENLGHVRTSPFIASKYLSAADFLESDDLVPASEAEPVKQLRATELVHAVLDAHHIDPYTGWDLAQLKTVVAEIRIFLASFWSDEKLSFEMNVLLAVCVYGERHNRGWSITELNVISDKARRHLGMKTVQDLNPDIKKMVEAGKASPFFKGLNDRFSGGIPTGETTALFTTNEKGSSLRESKFHRGLMGTAVEFTDQPSNTIESSKIHGNFKLIPVDNPLLSTSNSILPQAMIVAGEEVLKTNRNYPPEAAAEIAVEVFRAMVEAAPSFGGNYHNDPLAKG